MKSFGVALLFAVFVGLVLTSPAPESPEGSEEKAESVEEKREAKGSMGVVKRFDGSSCYGSGRWYRHGELFHAAICNSYRCERGQFVTYEEGCEHNGQCYQTNQEFQVNCMRYRCTVTNMGSHKVYQIIPSGHQMCEDYYGSCRNPGDFFPYNMKGYIKHRCTCQIYGNTIGYVCYD